jgi:hypothetical protein
MTDYAITKISKSPNKGLYDRIDSLGLAVFLAIEENDYLGIEYIFNTKIIDGIYKSEAANLLNYAYTTDNLKIATLLIRNEAKFYPTNLLRVHVTSENITFYKNQLDDVSHLISNTYFEESQAILTALISKPVANNSFLSCFNLTQILSQYSVTNDKNSAAKILSLYHFLTDISSNSPIVEFTLSAIAIDILKQKNTILVTTHVKNSLRSAQYSRSDDFSMKKIIYMPFYNYDNLEKSIFIHELGHYAEDAIFNNQALPYFGNNSAEYKLCVISVIKNLINVTHSSEATLTLYKMIEENNNIYKIAQFLKRDSFLPLFSFKSHGHETDYINDAFTLYCTRIECNQSGVTLQSKKNYVQATYDKIAKIHSLSDSDLEVLDRMSEALFRPEYSIEAEFIVRPAEFEVKNIEKSSLKLIDQLIEYSINNIIPVVEKLKSEISLPICEVAGNDTYDNHNEF